jgi:hypothetical protein
MMPSMRRLRLEIKQDQGHGVPKPGSRTASFPKAGPIFWAEGYVFHFSLLPEPRLGHLSASVYVIAPKKWRLN